MTTTRKPKAATPANAWGSSEPSLHELPSGKHMVLRPGPCMSRLVRQGIIPNPLLGAVLESNEDGEIKSRVDWKSHEEHKSAVVCAMAVDPPVTLEPLDGAVVYDALDERDVDYIISIAQEGVADLATFRGK